MTTTRWNAEARPYKVGKARRIADYGAVRSRYDAGETCQEIADTLGCSRSRIAQIVSDITRPGARLPVNKLKIEQSKKKIETAIRAGRTISEISKLMGISQSEMSHLIRVRLIRPANQTLHGTVASYNHGGCRCEKCRTAFADYTRNRRHARQNGFQR